jgi:predicted metal-dependent hydrolase
VEKKERLEESDTRLRALYHRIKEKYFDGNYLPDPNHVAFHWKRGASRGGWCRKSQKLIKIGGKYRAVFEGSAPIESTRYLVHLIIHEAVHLRMAHHRKSFKQKVAETEAKVKPEDLPVLFAGLIKTEV